MKSAHVIPLIALSLLLNACSKDAEPETIIDSQVIELKYDGQHQYVIKKGADILPASSLSYKSNNELVGKISTDGILKARKIGSTVVTATVQGKEFMSWVTITPYSTIIQEPVFEFGTDKSTIKSQVVSGTLVAEGESFLIFSSFNPNLKQVLYAFDQKRLVAVALDFVDSASVQKEAITFFKERYPIPAAVNEKDSVFINDEQTRVAYPNINESLGFNVTYGQVIKKGERLLMDPNGLNWKSKKGFISHFL